MALLEYIGFLGCFQFFVTLMCVLYLPYTEPEKHRPIKVHVHFLTQLNPNHHMIKTTLSVADLRGVQIISIDAGFFGENLAKSYVGAPPTHLSPPPRIGAPTSGKFWIRHCLSSLLK